MSFGYPHRLPIWQTGCACLLICASAFAQAAAAQPAPISAAAPENKPPLIVIDDDELSEQQATIEYQALPVDGAGSAVKVGARFPVVICSELSSKTAKCGDPVQAQLKYDLKIGDRLIAVKGSTVTGHVDYALRARTPVRCTLSTHRWCMTSGCIGIKFDEVINEKGEHIPLVAEPAMQALYVKNKAEGRVLGINHKGQVAAPFSLQVKYLALRMALNAAMTPAGVFSFGAMPLALGLIGAADPSFAFGKPVGYNVRHRRLKGFALAAFSGVPGSFLIEGTTIKGEEAIIKPGDEFLVEMRKEFDGKPSLEGDMLAGAEKQVHAEVVKNNGDGKTGSRK